MWEMFAESGAADPRLNTVGKLYFSLGRKMPSYTWADTPQYQVHPLQISILHLLDATTQSLTQIQQIIS